MEVILIRLSIQSKKKEVVEFIEELKMILLDVNFDMDRDLIIIKKNKGRKQYSTPYTLLNLEYDTSDVVERLKELTVEEYSETFVDRDNVNPPLLFVFGKNINNELIYIKLKIKGDQTRHILCVSFHYAEHAMIFPYA